MSDQKQKSTSVVSVRQFNALRTRVKQLEKWKGDLEASSAGPGEITDPPGGTDTPPEEDLTRASGARLSRFRGFIKRNPVFWTAGCLMVGYVLGCIICDFSTFGGY